MRTSFWVRVLVSSDKPRRRNCRTRWSSCFRHLEEPPGRLPQGVPPAGHVLPLLRVLADPRCRRLSFGTSHPGSSPGFSVRSPDDWRRWPPARLWENAFPDPLLISESDCFVLSCMPPRRTSSPCHLDVNPLSGAGFAGARLHAAGGGLAMCFVLGADPLTCSGDRTPSGHANSVLGPLCRAGDISAGSC